MIPSGVILLNRKKVMGESSESISWSLIHSIGLLLDARRQDLNVVGAKGFEIPDTRSCYSKTSVTSVENLTREVHTATAADVPFRDENITEFGLCCKAFLHKGANPLHGEGRSWAVLKGSLNESHVHLVLDSATVAAEQGIKNQNQAAKTLNGILVFLTLAGTWDHP